MGQFYRKLLNNEMAVTFSLNSALIQVVFSVLLFSGTVSYEYILLEESRLCKLKPDDHEASVLLGKEQASSKIITQKIYFASWTGRYNFKCSFSVTAPSYYGLYAVIQALNFRRNETTKICKDYVHIRAPQPFLVKMFNKEKKPEKYFCGKIYAPQTYSSNSNESGSKYNGAVVSNNSFVAHNGHIHVTIYIAQERLLSNEKLEIKIAFTSFKKECSKRKNAIQCKPCEWIWEGLVDDEVQNCPYTSHMDENPCNDSGHFHVHNVISNETGTKVTIAAISAIMVTFFIFAICLCAYRRSQRCCWQLSSNDSVRLEMNRSRVNTGEEFVTSFHELPSDSISPSAPTITDMKDVPPSYESLFPSK